MGKINDSMFWSPNLLHIGPICGFILTVCRDYNSLLSIIILCSHLFSKVSLSSHARGPTLELIKVTKKEKKIILQTSLFQKMPAALKTPTNLKRSPDSAKTEVDCSLHLLSSSWTSKRPWTYVDINFKAVPFFDVVDPDPSKTSIRIQIRIQKK